MKVKRRMHKLKVNEKLLLCKREKVRYGGRCINDEEEDSILGKCCLIWFHFRCKGLKKAPKAAKMFLSSMLLTLTDIL